MLISFDGLKFHGGMGRARFTVEHGGLDGWFESPGIRREDKAREGGHGSFVARTFKTGRVVSWRGLVHSTSPAAQRRDLEQLAGMAHTEGVRRLTVQHDAEATWADAQLNSAPDVQILSYGRLARYEVELWCPAPWRFGETRSFPVGSAAFHYGNVDAWPVVVVPSAPAAYSLSAGGRVFQVDGAPAGGTHRVDMVTGRLTRNNIPVLGGVTRADVWPVGRGVRLSWSGPAGSRVEVADTFM